MTCAGLAPATNAVDGHTISDPRVTLSAVSYSFDSHTAEVRVRAVANAPVSYANIICRFMRNGRLLEVNNMPIIDRRSGDDTIERISAWVSDEPDVWSCRVVGVQ
jgi:hypothetical protein